MVKTELTLDTFDTFTRAYIKCALWSSTGEPFGDCAACDRENTVLYWSVEDREHILCAECSGEDREKSPYEPPLDKFYDIGSIAPETLARMVADCERFQREHPDAIDETNLVYQDRQENASTRAGHDFWLTRNGHGAGFWDGDWTEPAATELTKAAKTFGEMSLYVGDDGRIYA